MARMRSSRRASKYASCCAARIGTPPQVLKKADRKRRTPRRRACPSIWSSSVQKKGLNPPTHSDSGAKATPSLLLFGKALG